MVDADREGNLANREGSAGHMKYRRLLSDGDVSTFPGKAPAPTEGQIDRSRTVYDPDGNVFYEPFISDDGRVGYRVGRTDDRPDAETFIYFNPSTTERDDTPNVFVYIGIENDPNEDDPQHFYTLTKEDFGL
jgi:hypothetical protein